MSNINPLSIQQLPENARERILSEDYVSLIFHNETYPFDIGKIRAEFLPQQVDWQYAILNAPLSEYPPSISQQGYFTIPKLYTLLDTTSLEVSGIDKVQNQPFLNLTGKGICIGFIDTGINYQHPSFRNADGTSRILSIWDQTIQTGELPEGFLYGSEYTQEQINQALRSPEPYSIVPSRDENGHGTALAGIAAGTRDETAQFSGAAPEADIIAVKLKPAKQYLRDYFLATDDAIAYQEDDCMLALRYLEMKSRELDKPMVVCFGLATNQGGHDGYTPLDEGMSYLTFLTGIYCVAAAGNEVGKSHHYFGKISRPEETQEIEVVVDEANRGFTLEFWAFSPELYALGVTSPLGERISPLDPRIGASQNISLLLDKSRVQIEYEVVEFRSGSQLIQVRVENPSVGNWRFQIVNKRYLNGSFHLWLPITGIGSPYVRFLNPEPDTTVVVPSCNSDIVTVSTYQAYTNTIYLHSSRGLTRNERLKPDIAAPGVNVQVPAVPSGYTRMTGSSAASALTAGAVALLVQWGLQTYNRKVLSSTEIKNLLYRGASRQESIYYPNRVWGFGALNVYGIFESLANF